MLLAAAAVSATAEVPIDYSAEAIGTASTAKLAPYYMASNNYGTLTQERTYSYAHR